VDNVRSSEDNIRADAVRLLQLALPKCATAAEVVKAASRLKDVLNGIIFPRATVA